MKYPAKQTRPRVQLPADLGTRKAKPAIEAGFEMISCPEQDSNLHICKDTSP